MTLPAPSRATTRAATPRHLAPVVVAAALCAALLAGCRGERAPTELTEAPSALGEAAVARTTPRAGRLGIRARVAYADIEAIAADALPEHRPESGSRRVCKRVLGIPLCGDARWDLTLSRTAAPRLDAAGERVRVRLPLRFDGTVGLEGRLARTLGLDALAVRGAARAEARLALDVDARWCPRARVDVDYAWTERPELAWSAGLDFDLQSVLDRALQKRLDALEGRVNERIDCERFRETLASYWRGYHVPLSLPGTADAWLNVVPTGFAFSGVRAEPEALGVGFAFEGTAVVEAEPAADLSPPLPPFERVDYAPGRADFEILIRAGYDQLEAAAIPALIGRVFETDSAAGAVRVTPTSLGIAGNGAGVTVTLGFEADLPATRRATIGVIYLTATPTVDAEAERVTLGDIRLSRVLDNRLWRLVGDVFERQIVGALRTRAVLELGPRAAELERLITAQLSDPARTGGLAVEAREVDVRLLELIAERDALVAVARVGAELDVTVPLAVLERPLDR